MRYGLCKEDSYLVRIEMGIKGLKSVRAWSLFIYTLFEIMYNNYSHPNIEKLLPILHQGVHSQNMLANFCWNNGL